MDGCMAMRLGGPFQQAAENWEPSMALKHRTGSLTGLRAPLPAVPKAWLPAHYFKEFFMNSAQHSRTQGVFLSSSPVPAGRWINTVGLSLLFLSSPPFLPPFVAGRVTDDRHTVIWPKHPSPSGRNMIMSLIVKMFQGQNFQLLLSTYRASNCIHPPNSYTTPNMSVCGEMFFRDNLAEV